MTGAAQRTTGTELQKREIGLHEAARNWTSLHDDELRRRAVQAARDRDHESLLSLWRASLAHLSKSGVKTSPHTEKTYRSALLQSMPLLEGSGFDLIRPGRHAAQDLVAQMIGSGLAPATVELRVAALRSLWSALRWAGATEADPWRGVKIPRDPTPGTVKNPPYREEEIEAILALDPTEHGDARLLSLLCGHAGLRISEALSLSWNQVDGTRLRVHGKGRKERIVALSKRTQAELEAHRRRWLAPTKEALGKRRTPADKIFSFASPMTAAHHAQRAWLAAGVEWRGFHAARKTAGTRLLAQVRDFGRVAAHLGHASVDTTRKGYAVLAADDLMEEVSDW